ncbi:hypothetical protein ACQCT6_10540 [Cytobacillus gottheilii]|uniref:hypothetical protein n=1 Tax=Cytobacillus gottheilii TaxID=859144 RepID=UPI003CF0637F
MNNTKIIQLQWEGPYNLDQLPILTNEEIDYGVYQIYGKQPIYGHDVLLYLGQANEQTFGKRIAQERWRDTNDSNNHKIYVGRIIGETKPSNLEWFEEITLAEQLLIAVHKPAFNSKSLFANFNLKLQNIHILNWGNYRDLFPEVSGLRWSNANFEIESEVYKWEG